MENTYQKKQKQSMQLLLDGRTKILYLCDGLPRFVSLTIENEGNKERRKK